MALSYSKIKKKIEGEKHVEKWPRAYKEKLCDPTFRRSKYSYGQSFCNNSHLPCLYFLYLTPTRAYAVCYKMEFSLQLLSYVHESFITRPLQAYSICFPVSTL
jgi:hypothetical protein